MLSDEISGEEQRTIESQYADHFYTGNYYVCCQNQVKRGELSDDNYIFMKNMNDNDIFIVPAENLSLLLKNEHWNQCGALWLREHPSGICGVCHDAKESICPQ